MQVKRIFTALLVLTLLSIILGLPSGGKAAPSRARLLQSSTVTAYDLILAINTLRASYGLPALQEDPIVNAVAQSTAEIMAANLMSWHIGDVRGRLAAAGYGGGATVWATENFAVGVDFSIDQIMQVWADPTHMIPAVNPAYCHVGAGVAKAANGSTYYILQAAYTSAKACGEYRPPEGSDTTNPGEWSEQLRGISQVIVPVKIATPDASGQIFHVVESGQSYWAIAIAYQITIKDLEVWNNLSSENKLQIGQRLFIPSSNTAGYATPTPVGMVQVSLPDQDGKIFHTVQAYQALITIAQAYGTSVDTILALNGLQIDWPLQIGQKLLIDPGSVTPSPTPRPLTPLEKLTPASDGKYYHTVKSGETLSWIADLYEVSVFNLMNWNGLTGSDIYPNQQLVLQVTPPASQTPTPAPPTLVPTATSAPPSPTQTKVQPSPTPSPTDIVESSTGSDNKWFRILLVGLAVVGVVLVVYLSRHKDNYPHKE